MIRNLIVLEMEGTGNSTHCTLFVGATGSIPKRYVDTIPVGARGLVLVGNSLW
jgi:hypothetical protein